MEQPANPQEKNEDTYESLISLIENSQQQLAPIIVACDDWALRQRVIDRYESEAREAKIIPYRVTLGREPSVRAALAKLKEENEYLQRGGEAVFTVTGAETLLRVKLKPEDEQSELDKFFGYLQWTREGLREFRYPIVLWVTYRILKEMSRRAPDFWSWRKAVLRFATETEDAIASPPPVDRSPIQPNSIEPSSDNFLPPLEELQAEIQKAESTPPDSPNLATLYERLGQVYVNRVRTGKAANLEQEREAAIEAFQKAIQQYQRLGRKYGQGNSLNKLGVFLHSQSRPRDAIELYQQSLEIDRELGDRQGEAITLNNLSNIYDSLGQYQQAINLVQQSLEIVRELGNRQAEAASLINLGIAYKSGGRYHQAVELFQQGLEIARETGNRQCEINALANLGDVCRLLGQYQQAIELYQQSIEISRMIGNQKGEAVALFNQAHIIAKLDQRWEALQKLKQAKQLYTSLGFDDMVEKCDTAIYNFNQNIVIEPRSFPKIRDELPLKPKRTRKQVPLWIYFLIGLAIVLLIAWLL